MLYEYPEEFVVPVIYSRHLMHEKNREESNEYSNNYREAESFDKEVSAIEDDELSEIATIVSNVEEDATNDKLDKRGILKDQFQENWISDNSTTKDLEYKKMQDTWNEIDSEYANGETGRI